MKVLVVLLILLIGGYVALKKYKPELLFGERLEVDKTLEPSGVLIPGLWEEFGIRTIFVPRDMRISVIPPSDPTLG